ncbi:MAG: LacI family transcriptional regulator [Treponema sp.]|nr:LacI family transcriptional regulator [Treponema sp.]
MLNSGKKKYKETTVNDIAQAIGVSATTVSRVLSRSGYPVNPEVRTKILQAAGDLNYKPSLVYRSSKNFEKEIALLISTFSNPFFTSISTGFEAIVAKEGFHSIVYNVNSWLTGSNPQMLLYSILRKKVKGILVASPIMYAVAEEFKNDFFSRNIKVVMADCPIPNNFFSNVYYDYKKGSSIATEYLINLGHTDIIYAGLKLERESRKMMVQGFQEAMRNHGIPFENKIFILDSPDQDENTQIESGERLAYNIKNLAKKPSAVVAMNDIVAFGILRGFHKMNIKVPEDISLIGFDDSIFCDMSYPALTTVKVQSEQMGRMAAMLLLNDINGSSQNPVSLYLEPCIVERDSVSKI